MPPRSHVSTLSAAWPLETFERAFMGLGDEPSLAPRCRTGRSALHRSPKRRDSADRVVPHYGVVYGPVVGGINSLEPGLEQICPS